MKWTCACAMVYSLTVPDTCAMVYSLTVPDTCAMVYSLTMPDTCAIRLFLPTPAAAGGGWRGKRSTANPRIDLISPRQGYESHPSSLARPLQTPLTHNTPPTPIHDTMTVSLDPIHSDEATHRPWTAKSSPPPYA